MGDNSGAVTEALRIRQRIAALDWAALRDALDADGYARIPSLLTTSECRALAQLYGAEPNFRTTISLEGYRFGQGEYKYFRYPLPPLVAALRECLYPRLAVIANHWNRRRGASERFPKNLRTFLTRCRGAGQTRPTPLLLHYTAEGYNRLHQDLYGAIAFPIQLTCLLSRRGTDFTGGEFLLVEHRPRMQSRGEAIALEAGEGILFPTRDRPVTSARGFTAAQTRHGVSRVRSGKRTTLGIIFHDAK